MATLILVDGPASSGKGTLAARLAQHFGFQHLDSGTFYRAVAARQLLTQEDTIVIVDSLGVDDFTTRDLRSQYVSRRTALISAIPEVRAAINNHLRRRILGSKGVVMDGRAGAAEFPEAQAKIYLDASLEERARRRFRQLHVSGAKVRLSLVMEELRIRDDQDQAREVSPLKKDLYPYRIDSTEMDAATVFLEAVDLCDYQFNLIEAQHTM